MGRYLRPSVCAATICKNFLIVPLKATIFEKFTFNIQIKLYPLSPTIEHGGRPQISGKSLWQAAYHWKKLV
jgi:hypothetical protein